MPLETLTADTADLEGPLLLMMDVEWSGPCRLCDATLLRLAQDYEGSVAIARMDADANSEWALSREVDAVPMWLLFHQEIELGRWTGAVPLHRLRRWIKDALGINRKRRKR